MGESGVGKSSFLQAGILPQLAKEESRDRGIYIRFSNRDPIETICQTLVKELEISETSIDHQNLLEIFSLAVKSSDKPLILIFDQFEQFFVHCKQKSDREPFINDLPIFLTQNAIAIDKKLTASMFDPGVNSCCETTVCGLSSNQHQNQLNFE